MPKVLRPMAAGDADDVVTLQEVGAIVGLGHIFHQDEHPFPAPEIRGRWLKEIETPGLDCHVILDRGRAAGFAALRADELLHFGTAMDTWGSGLAGLAHDELLECSDLRATAVPGFACSRRTSAHVGSTSDAAGRRPGTPAAPPSHLSLCCCGTSGHPESRRGATLLGVRCGAHERPAKRGRRHREAPADFHAAAPSRPLRLLGLAGTSAATTRTRWASCMASRSKACRGNGPPRRSHCCDTSIDGTCISGGATVEGTHLEVSMFERFTEEARQVIVLAQEECRLRNDPTSAPSTCSWGCRRVATAHMTRYATRVSTRRRPTSSSRRRHRRHPA